MKEVISGKELKEIMIKAVNLLCDAVGATLGPSGNNVIINSDLSPYITNDGATIAQTISSSDKKTNTILEIAKEASLKTNEKVGDGTTTTLVLLQSIFNEGLKEIENGINPIFLKKRLNLELNNIIEKLNKMKKIPTEEELYNIALTSSEDIEIAKLVIEVYLKMNNKYSIKLDESNNEKTYYEIKKGYTIEDIDIPTIYFNNINKIEINDAYVLLLNGYLTDLEQISDIINEGLIRDKNVIIFVEDYDEEVKNDVLLYYLKSNKNIFLFKMPNYGSQKENIISDISSITKSNVKNIDFDNIRFNDLGKLDKIEITKANITLISNNNIYNYINKLKQELNENKSIYEKELLENRISKLEKGVATIYVGGNTKTEIKEKIMRFEDSLCALDIARKGILLGEGIPLLKISNEINDNILKNSLQQPFIKILENSGYTNYEQIKNEILSSNYQKVFNLETGKLELYTIIDPYLVVVESLRNAVSIATMLLTTNYLVINEEINIGNEM